MTHPKTTETFQPFVSVKQAETTETKIPQRHGSLGSAALPFHETPQPPPLGGLSLKRDTKRGAESEAPAAREFVIRLRCSRA
jgi:hypothetical protein